MVRSELATRLHSAFLWRANFRNVWFCNRIRVHCIVIINKHRSIFVADGGFCVRLGSGRSKSSKREAKRGVVRSCKGSEQAMLMAACMWKQTPGLLRTPDLNTQTHDSSKDVRTSQKAHIHNHMHVHIFRHNTMSRYLHMRLVKNLPQFCSTWS